MQSRYSILQDDICCVCFIRLLHRNWLLPQQSKEGKEEEEIRNVHGIPLFARCFMSDDESSPRNTARIPRLPLGQPYDGDGIERGAYRKMSNGGNHEI